MGTRRSAFRGLPLDTREPFGYAVVPGSVARADETPLSIPLGAPGAPGGGSSLPSRARDDVDPELLALPAPPPGRRIATLTLMAAVVVASIALAASLRHDLAYFFAPAAVADLGDVGGIDPATLRPNSYVRISGTPTSAATVHYRRVVTGETYAVFPLAGQRTVFVHVPASIERSGRTEYAGRLVTFGQLGGRMRGVQEYLTTGMDMPASPESFVLLVDESPSTYVWALALVALCAIFVLIDLLLVLRWFRPLPHDGQVASEGSAAGDA